jgi:hypothetical protein
MGNIMALKSKSTLTSNSIETLIDLVEIKLSCIEIMDRDDARTVKSLEQCRGDLYALLGKPPVADVISLREQAAA